MIQMKTAKKNVKRLIRCFNRLGCDGCEVFKALFVSMKQHHENLDSMEAYTAFKRRFQSKVYLWTERNVYTIYILPVGYKITRAPIQPLPGSHRLKPQK